MTTAARKKTKNVIQSTDRGGAVLLPAGVMVMAFGFMLLLGVMLQTSSGALNLFKYMAIGLGGGLYFLVPVMVIWLGGILVISAKRYVSVYPFLISLLLIMCIGALLTLTLRVNDQSYPRLMHYIKNLNSLRGAGYPDSMGEYLHEAYHRYQGLRSDNNFYPGGGVLGMLVAYPLFITLGNFGATTLTVLLVIALLFALARVSPARLAAQISHKINRPPERRPAAERPQTVQAQTGGDMAAAQAYPEDLNHQDYQIAEQQQWQPQEPVEPAAAGWVDMEPYPATSASWNHAAGLNRQQPPFVQPQPEVEPGFIPQTGAIFEEDFPPAAQPAAKPALRPEPVFETARARQTVEPVQLEPEFVPAPAPVAAQLPVSEPVVARERPAGRRTGSRQQAAAVVQPEAPAIPRKERTAPVQLPAEEAMPQPVQETPPPVVTPEKEPVFKTVNKPAQAMHTAPAVPLSGERTPVARRAAAPEAATLDGMARKPEPKQIKLALDDYEVPPKRLLTAPPQGEINDTTEEDQRRGVKLIETLKSFQITAHLHDIVHGPTVTRFAIRLAEGINVNKLRNVMDNLTIELKAKGDIRAEMPIPGTSFVGLEVSNDKTTKVFLREVLESSRMKENPSPTAVALGKDITGTPIVCELMDMPHLLIAGATGSGKSVCINSIICSILYRASPRHVRLIMVDPKFVELQPYNDVPHLMMPVITDAKKATAALDWVCQEMDERYQILVEAGVRNLDAYNKRLGPDEEPLPRIIVIVDEMADLMTTSGKMIEDHIKRITAKARAAGICLILATQRPSVNIITGVIKANIPGRIAFRVSSPFDSKTILDSNGAEKLLGYGDMLFRSTTREPIRVQGCFVADKDVEQTVDYIRSRNKADYNLDLMEHVDKSESGDSGNGMGDGMDNGGDGEFDELLPQAIEMAVEAGQMSISMLQRVLRVGYARSGRLIDEMERRGIISGNEGTKPRKTLMTREQYMSYLEQEDT